MPSPTNKRQVSFLISFHGPVAVEQVTQVPDYMVLHFESYRASSRRLAITLKRALGMEGRGRLKQKKDCVFVMPRLIRLFALLWNGLRCASRVREDSTRCCCTLIRFRFRAFERRWRVTDNGNKNKLVYCIELETMLLVSGF